MMRGLRYFRILLLIAAVPLGGCLVRSRPVALRTSTTQLATASSNDLVERLNTQAGQVQTLKAAVGITASLGGSERGKITEYREIHGYILARKPSSLRMIGFFPILENQLFDLVSSGGEFRLWIPSKNRFIVGNGDVERPSTQPLENLRPQVIYDALLLEGIDLNTELAALEEGEHKVIDPGTHKPALQGDYTLDIIRQDGHGWYLSRKTVFDRSDLQLHQQRLYDEHGSVVTDVRYDEYREFNGMLFPTLIEILRPQEEYSIRLKVTNLTINGPIKDNQFLLELPSGAALESR